MCWYAHIKSFVPHETMVERMVVSTSSASNVHGVEIDNNNPYRTTIMDAIRMNQGSAGQCWIVNEKPNANVARFFIF